MMKQRPTNTLFPNAEHIVKVLFVDNFRLDYFKGSLFQYSISPLSIPIHDRAIYR
jgi:hypothetical protein